MKRKHSRLKWMLFSLPVAVVLLAFAFKLMGLSVTTQVAIVNYNSGAYTASRDASSTLLEGDLLGGNFIEPWIPWFNRGDAKAGDGDYTPAIDDFERALDLAPEDKECLVRVNLSLSWELLGDIYEAEGYHDGAVRLYEAGEAVITDAGDKCDPPDPAAEELDAAGERLEDKKAAAQEQSDQEAAAEPDPSEQEQKLDELGDKDGESGQQKADDEARDRGEDEGGSTYTDKPW